LKDLLVQENNFIFCGKKTILRNNLTKQEKS